MNAKFIDSWTVYTGSISQIIAKAVESGEFDESDTVWRGADGSYIIGDVMQLDSEELDADLYTDAGTAGEYLD
jgi:hypothetical protein